MARFTSYTIADLAFVGSVPFPDDPVHLLAAEMDESLQRGELELLDDIHVGSGWLVVGK